MVRLTLYLIEMPFKTFANIADPDQAAFVCKCDGYDPTLVDLTSNVFIICTNCRPESL